MEVSVRLTIYDGSGRGNIIMINRDRYGGTGGGGDGCLGDSK